MFTLLYYHKNGLPATSRGLPYHRSYTIVRHAKKGQTVEFPPPSDHSHHCFTRTPHRWNSRLSFDRRVVVLRCPLYDCNHHHHGRVRRDPPAIERGKDIYGIPYSVRLRGDGVCLRKHCSNIHRRPNPNGLREEKIGEEGQKAEKSLSLMRLWPYRLFHR